MTQLSHYIKNPPQVASLPDTTSILDNNIEQGGLQGGQTTTNPGFVWTIPGYSGGYLKIDGSKRQIVINDGTKDIATFGIDGLAITGGTITGGIIQTNTTGQRIVLDGATSSLKFYDSTGTLVGSLKGLAIPIVPPLYYRAIQSDADFLIDNNHVLYMGNNTGDLIAIHNTASGELEIEGVGVIIDGDLNVDGTKNFRIDHPTKPGKKLVYTCPEMPEVLLMCRGTGEVAFPDHFAAMTEPDTVQVIKDHENGNWLATAVRKGYLDFNPEQDIILQKES